MHSYGYCFYFLYYNRGFLFYESSYESGQRFCLEPFQDGGESWIAFSEASWSIVTSSQCHVSQNKFINQLSNPQCYFLFSTFVLRRKGVIIFVLTFSSIALAAILDIDLMNRVIFGS